MPKSLYFNYDLKRVRALLAKVGNPELRLPPVFHVAGTNGKGSVIAICRAILEESGYIVHTFTSPHLVEVQERVRIGKKGGGKLINKEDYLRVITGVKHILGDTFATFFEISTVAALLLFSEQHADFALMEVGIGGRLDATNVIPPPLVAVITRVLFDHEDMLGGTLQKIAFEKAGIIKPGTTAVVSSPQNSDVVEVIRFAAKRSKVPLYLGLRDWIAVKCSEGLQFRDQTFSVTTPPPQLAGDYQYENTGTAIAALRCAGLSLDKLAICEGVKKVYWPARMQKLSSGPLLSLIPDDSEIWLDGGHNPGAGAVIADMLVNLHRQLPRSLYVLIGMMKGKDHDGFLRELFNKNDIIKMLQRCIAVSLFNDDDLQSADVLAYRVMRLGLKSDTADGIVTALLKVKEFSMIEKTVSPLRVLICGSLRLSGAALDLNGMYIS